MHLPTAVTSQSQVNGTAQGETRKAPAGGIESFTSVFSFLMRREQFAATLGGIQTLESSQDLGADFILSLSLFVRP